MFPNKGLILNSSFLFILNSSLYLFWFYSVETFSIINTGIAFPITIINIQIKHIVFLNIAIFKVSLRASVPCTFSGRITRHQIPRPASKFHRHFWGQLSVSTTQLSTLLQCYAMSKCQALCKCVKCVSFSFTVTTVVSHPHTQTHTQQPTTTLNHHTRSGR